MKEGKIAEQGTFTKLMQDDKEFAALMREHGGEKAKGAAGETSEEQPGGDSKLLLMRGSCGQILHTLICFSYTCSY